VSKELQSSNQHRAALTYLGGLCALFWWGLRIFFTVKLTTCFNNNNNNNNSRYFNTLSQNVACQFSRLPGGGASNVVEHYVHVHIVHIG